MFKDKIYRTAFIISILLHLLLFLFYQPLSTLTAFLENDSKAVETQPLTFELVEPEQPSELIETPRDAQVQEPPRDAAFLSDKNARNQDMYDMNQLSEGQAYSEGLSEFNTFRGGKQSFLTPPNEINQQNSEQQDQKQPEEQNKVKDGEPVYEKTPMSMGKQPFSKELLQQSIPRKENRPGSEAYTDDVNRDNRESDARALGGVALSTYKWDYAPYLLYMKRRLKERLYLPQTFVRDGVISGQVTIQFRLLRNGNVENLKMIENRGHSAFISPTLNTVRASNPFKPLPNSFPDPYLDLTWTFVYSIY